MQKIYIYNVTDDYIKYLTQFDNKVFDNKIGKRKHMRAYIGVVLEVNGTKYFAPLSSPKPKDYNADGTIRRNPIFLTRIVTIEKGQPSLKGKILFSNMIPIVDSAVVRYDIANEKDKKYQDLIIKEIDFITKHRVEIYHKANLIYSQKIAEKTLKTVPTYLLHTIDFKLLESKSKNYKK